MFEWVVGARMSVRAQITAIAVAGSSAAAPVALAQTPVMPSLGSLVPTEIAVGGIAVVTPRYEGSKQYKVMGAPFIAPGGPETDMDRLKVKGADDVRLRVITVQGLELGGLTGWRFGREEDDGDRLAGLGDVHGGLIVGGYAAYHMGPITPFVSYHHQVTGSETGGILRFGAEAKMQLTPAVKLTGVAGATYADDTYMQAFFGVTPAQSLTSKLAVFDAGAGIKDTFVEVGTELRLYEAWKLKLSGRYTRLLGDAAASPVTETADQFSGMLTLSYEFRLPGL